MAVAVSPNAPDILSAYLFLWGLQGLVTVHRYIFGDWSIELLAGAFGVLAGITGSVHLGLAANIAFVAAKCWREPLQFNSDVWIGLADFSCVVAGLAHGWHVGWSIRTRSQRDALVLAFAPAVRRAFAVCYCGAGIWKINTAHLQPSTSCSTLFFMTLLTEYAPYLAATPAFAQAVAVAAGTITVIIETSIGLLLLGPTPAIQRIGVVLGIALHAGICLTPPPNNIGAFSAVATMRYFTVVPFGTAAVLGWARNHAMMVGASLAAIVALAHARVPRAVDDPQAGMFWLMSIIITSAVVVEIRDACCNNGKRKGQLMSPVTSTQPRVVRVAQHVCLALGLFYAFGIVILGLQDMGNTHMFANLRTHGGSNHYILPTALLQKWSDMRRAKLAVDDGTARQIGAGPFEGGSVRIDRTTSTFINGIYPMEVTSLLDPEARHLLTSPHIGHVGRQFLPIVGRIYGPPAEAMSNPSRPVPKAIHKTSPFTTHALELRRLIADALASGETNFTISYARLPTDTSGAVDWDTAATAGIAVTIFVDGAKRTCTIDATKMPCHADEPALMPWPPAGPPLAIWLLLKILVWNPAPLLPGFTEMACSDG